MGERILEIHHFIELDKQRYSFPYMVDRQLQSLVRAYEERDAKVYINVFTGD